MKRNLSLCFALVLFALSVVSCSSAPGEAPTRDELVGRDWTVVSIGDILADPNVRSFITFDAEGRVKGSGGCNTFFGNYRLDGSSMSIGPIGATKMACAGPRGDQEALFFQALGKVETALFDQGTLTLSGKNGELMRLEAD